MLKTVSLSIGLMAGLSIWCANAPAQNNNRPSDRSAEVKQDTKTYTSTGTKDTTSDFVLGKVENYEQGKSIKVSVPGKIITSKTFDLSGNNLTAHVPSNVKVGDWVQVQETDGPNGHKVVDVKPSSEDAAVKAEKR